AILGEDGKNMGPINEGLSEDIKEEPLDDDLMLELDGKRGEKMDTINIDLARENAALKMEMDKMLKEHNDRVAQLTLKLTQCDGVQEVLNRQVDDLKREIGQGMERNQALQQRFVQYSN
ncbi:hypothetical protein PENTCL1PPCAC_24202, partial [Pristionchus entomophagus]